MKDYYLYERTEDNKPMITECFLIDGDEYARGISVCSYGDNPCKATGRKIAFERARQALFTRSSFKSDNPSVKHNHPYFITFYKGVYMPSNLTEVEKKFLNNYKNRQARE